MPRRVLEGTVVSDKGDKTVIVSVERRVMHPIYKKFIRRSKRYAAHDPENRFKTGDFVRIRKCRPISRTKSWEVLTGALEGETETSGGVGAAVVACVTTAASRVAEAVSGGVAAVASVVASVTGSASDTPPESGA